MVSSAALASRGPARAQRDAARGEEIVLGVAELALGDGRALVVEVHSVESDLHVAQDVADTGGPGDVVGGEGGVALVEEAAADPVRLCAAAPAGALADDELGRGHVAGRHLQALPAELRGHA